jgi:hypothetical protein
MSRQEASWHEHVAGQRASAAARQTGADPAALDAVARATMGPVVIAGLTLRPASEGTFITLRKCAAMFAAHADALGLPHATSPQNPGERELYELGLASLVFADARRVFRALTAGQLPALMEEAMELIFGLPLADRVALSLHIETQMAEINRLSGAAATDATPGKPEPTASPEPIPPPPAPGHWPARPNPPTAPPSPPSNGSWPNTD